MTTSDRADGQAGAALASALMAAKYGGDSGEDVDRLIAELASRGYGLAALAATPTQTGAEGPAELTGRDVHREWRDAMLAQGREVPTRRLQWASLSDQDRELDETIARRLRSGAEVAAAPGLDVERLRQGHRNLERRHDRAFNFDRDIDALAAEYARLTAKP